MPSPAEFSLKRTVLSSSRPTYCTPPRAICWEPADTRVPVIRHGAEPSHAARISPIRLLVDTSPVSWSNVRWPTEVVCWAGALPEIEYGIRAIRLVAVVFEAESSTVTVTESRRPGARISLLRPPRESLNSISLPVPRATGWTLRAMTVPPEETVRLRWHVWRVKHLTASPPIAAERS